MTHTDDQFGGAASHTWIRLASGKIPYSNVDPLSNIPIMILAAHHDNSNVPACQCPKQNTLCTEFAGQQYPITRRIVRRGESKFNTI